MQKNTKPNGFKYWEYFLCYVDDILVISHEPRKVMDHLSSRYTMKPESIKETRYLSMVGDPEVYHSWNN